MDGRQFLSNSGRDAPNIRLNGTEPGVGPSSNAHAGTQVRGKVLYSDPRVTFFAYDIKVPIAQEESEWEYTIEDVKYDSDQKPRLNRFFIPAADESMRLLFFSCNGFSVGTDEAAYSGPAVWNDVLRRQKESPFHVM